MYSIKNKDIIDAGGKVYLRLITEHDTPNIIKWRNKERVKNNFIIREPLTEQIHNNWLKNKVFSGKVIQYIIVEKKTNKDIGSVYIKDINKTNNSAEFGIFIGEDDCVGKGYGRNATELFIDYVFREVGLHRITLKVLEHNLAAIKTYLKVGFVFVTEDIKGIFKMVKLK